MNDLWVCVTGDKKLAIRCDHAMLTAHEARRFASQRLGADPFAVSINLLHEEAPGTIVVDVDVSKLPPGLVAAVEAPADESEPKEVPDWRGLEGRKAKKTGSLMLSVMPIVEVRWTGSDYSRGGTTDGRRMQEREPGKEWTNV